MYDFVYFGLKFTKIWPFLQDFKCLFVYFGGVLEVFAKYYSKSQPMSLDPAYVAGRVLAAADYF